MCTEIERLEKKLEKLKQKKISLKQGFNDKLISLNRKITDLTTRIENFKPRFYIGKIYKSKVYPDSLYVLHIRANQVLMINLTHSHTWQMGSKVICIKSGFKPGDSISYDSMKKLTGGRQDEFYLATIQNHNNNE